MRQLLGSGVARARAVTIVGLGVAGLSIVTGRAIAQAPQGEVSKTAKAPKPYTPPPIFMATQPMQITLVAPYRQLKKDRSGTATYRPAEITYVGDSGIVRVPLKVRTRGIWRRKNCDIPPLRLNFSKDSTKKTAFRHIDNVRLVMHCRDNDDYEQYVLQEYQLYRVQRLITPFSMDARLVRVTYVDAEKRTRWRRGTRTSSRASRHSRSGWGGRSSTSRVPWATISIPWKTRGSASGSISSATPISPFSLAQRRAAAARHVVLSRRLRLRLVGGGELTVCRAGGAADEQNSSRDGPAHARLLHGSAQLRQGLRAVPR